MRAYGYHFSEGCTNQSACNYDVSATGVPHLVRLGVEESLSGHTHGMQFGCLFKK